MDKKPTLKTEPDPPPPMALDAKTTVPPRRETRGDPAPPVVLPTVGRIVHVTIGGACHAAIVIEKIADSVVSLTVFGVGEQAASLQRNVPQGEGEGTWHWPERDTERP